MMAVGAFRLPRTLLRKSAKLLAAVSLLPLFFSCEFSGGTGPDGTYGFPYADFEVWGTVYDDRNQPLAGIRVYYMDSWWGMWYDDTLPDGTFCLRGNFTPSGLINLTTVDLGDGQNWGYYMDATVTVALDMVSEPDDSDDEWYQGLYAGEVDIMMFPDPSIPW